MSIIDIVGLAIRANNYPQRLLKGIFWPMAVIVGAVHVWAGSHMMGGDGISYLDIADAYFRGDWNIAINAYWSPLYSWLLGLALVVLKPSPFWEFPVVHLVNLAIYLCALGCFDFLLHELIHYHQRYKIGSSKAERVTFPTWAWLMLGYPLFIWSSLYLIDIKRVTPDMCVAASVYLASGILLRVGTGSTGWLTFILFGIALGFGYLAKAAMFPLAFIFLAISVFSVGNLRIAVPRVLVALAVFLALVGPFIAALSITKGRLTFGDTAKLNYAWFVNFVPALVHWQGEGPGSGTPKHPTRKMLADGIAIYEFRTPIGGTYPPWYDPSYWYEGVTLHFNMKGQIRALVLNAKRYLDLFTLNAQLGLIVGLLTFLLFMDYKRQLISENLSKYWNLLIPVIAALGMYALVLVLDRYVGAFIVILWLTAFSIIRLSESKESRRLVTSMTIAMTIMMLIAISSSTAETVYSKLRELRANESPYHWKIAEGLKQMGVKAGDEVAFIGGSDFGYAAYWARLARVRIIAETLPTDSRTFWAADGLVKFRVIETFAGIGAKAIVAECLTPCDSIKGWQRISGTNYYLFELQEKTSYLGIGSFHS